MDFEREGRDWPLRSLSRLVTAAGLRWHVQIAGSGPALLLVHGTGASTHSWRHVVPHLQNAFTLIIPDLPGHAFTSVPREGGFTLPAMAAALSALVAELKLSPQMVAGHSAGAAILMRAILDGGLAPRAIVSLNGALLPFAGVAGQIFSPLAKTLVSLSFVPRLMAWRAQNRDAVARLLRDMGSELSSEDVDLYARLFRDETHVAATLAMMANWDLEPLARDMTGLAVPVTLVASENDKAIDPEVAERVAGLVPRGQVIRVPGTGHLAHEEKPALIAGLLRDAARNAGVFDADEDR